MVTVELTLAGWNGSQRHGAAMFIVLAAATRNSFQIQSEAKSPESFFLQSWGEMAQADQNCVWFQELRL